MKILVINGPNLNLLGQREPQWYGIRTYADLEDYIRQCATNLGIEVSLIQSNSEGRLVTSIQKAYGVFDALVVNAAAYSHTSIALLDALRAVNLPTVNVHLSDLTKREPFRQTDYISLYAQKNICGEGFDGYRLALEFLAGNFN